MPDIVEIWEKPEAERIDMIVGWRQWADGGSVSSGLPRYLVQQMGAHKIGQIRGDGFYLFQIPGTHDLVRPTVRFDDGYPEVLETPRNEIYYAGDAKRGTVIFIGDEPHLDIERYIEAVLDVAKSLRARRIVGLGGVYGELPYDKERAIHCIYSKQRMKEELESLGVDFSNYQGGASIGSYLCRRAGDAGMEFVGFYAFVPTYDFSGMSQRGNMIRIENDYMAWLGIMRRINYMLKMRFALDDLEQKSEDLTRAIKAKIDELERSSPQLGAREYIRRLSESFDEVEFDPLDDVWEEELRRLLDDDGGEDAE